MYEILPKISSLVQFALLTAQFVMRKLKSIFLCINTSALSLQPVHKISLERQKLQTPPHVTERSTLSVKTDMALT